MGYLKKQWRAAKANTGIATAIGIVRKNRIVRTYNNLKIEFLNKSDINNN